MFNVAFASDPRNSFADEQASRVTDDLQMRERIRDCRAVEWLVNYLDLDEDHVQFDEMMNLARECVTTDDEKRIAEIQRKFVLSLEHDGDGEQMVCRQIRIIRCVAFFRPRWGALHPLTGSSSAAWVEACSKQAIKIADVVASRGAAWLQGWLDRRDDEHFKACTVSMNDGAFDDILEAGIHGFIFALVFCERSGMLPDHFFEAAIPKAVLNGR